MKNNLMNVLKTVFLLCLLASCKNGPLSKADPNGNSSNPAGSEGQSTSVPFGKLVGYRDDVCTLEGKDPLSLPPDPGVATLIALRPAETLPTRPSLSPEGIARSEKLSHTFVLCGIEQIYVEGNAALQTSTMVSRSNYCPTGYFQDDGLGNEEFLKFLVHNYKGKKTMVIGTHPVMNQLIRQIVGNEKYVLPADKYDHVFIIRAKAIGDAEVHHFTY